jgi:hypothetical protein
MPHESLLGEVSPAVPVFCGYFRCFGRRALRRDEAAEARGCLRIERPALLLSGHAALFGVHVNISMG